MTKELQDYVWSLLPKEFKEEVKKIYQDLTVNYDKYTRGSLEHSKCNL